MKIRKQMLLNNLLVGIIPVLLAVLIFILVFRARWEKTIQKSLSSSIEEIRTGINAEADRQRFFAFTIAGYRFRAK